MYLLFIAFLASLVGITILLGRKVMLLRNGSAEVSGNGFHPLLPDMLRAREWTKQGLKKYGYLALAIIMRFYFKFVNFLKSRYEALKETIDAKLSKSSNNTPENGTAEPEASGFLKMMSDYKHKIRNLKHRIKEEENQ